MRRMILASAVAVACMAIPSDAFGQVRAGPFAAFHDDADFGVGAFVNFPVPEIHENLAFSGDFGIFFPGDDSYFGADADYWELNANALYRFPLEDSSISPWALAGLNLARMSGSVEVGEFGSGERSDTEIGVNVGGGVTFGAGSMRPFAGAKVELSGGEGAVIFGGLVFDLGG